MQKSIKKTWLMLLILLLLFILLGILLGSNKPKEYPPYLSTSPSPSGTKAIYTLLDEELGVVERWEQPPSLLEDKANELLIMVEPALISDQATMDDYLEFIDAGNTILLFKRNLEGMFHISTDYYPVDYETVTISGEDRDYHATMFSSTRILPEDEDEIILRDDLGVIAIKREIGAGHLIAVNSPDWLTNKYILEEENLDLVINLLDEESWNSILIDEYTHRMKEAKGFTDIYPMWLLVAGFQAILFTLLGLLYKGKRFGPILVPREENVRFSDERITALAAWYKKGKNYTESLAMQADYLRLVLREKLGISYQKEWRDLEEPLSRKINSMKESEIASFVNEIEIVLNKQRISKQEFLMWSKRMERIRKEVEEG